MTHRALTQLVELEQTVHTPSQIRAGSGADAGSTSVQLSDLDRNLECAAFERDIEQKKTDDILW